MFANTTAKLLTAYFLEQVVQSTVLVYLCIVTYIISQSLA